MITVVPVNGLCNRLWMVSSALGLGRLLQREVRLVWKLRPELNCRFDRLFLPVPGLTHVTHVPHLAGLDSLLLRIAYRWAGWRGVDAWRHRHLQDLAREPAALIERARRARHVLVRGDLRFLACEPAFGGWKLVPSLAARVEALAPRLARAVGVHVRRTDHRRAMAHSPLEAFEAAMHTALASDPACTFFVASDDPGAKARLRQVFGTAVFHHEPASLDRNDPRGIEAAAVDLASLAACTRVLGSYGSSFSEVAAAWRGIPLGLAAGPAPA